ncbi:MAG TPA: ABC transporter substrate-binding protein [Bacillota bacterium]|nr:ABC transporter substrate-binding protein [Bacillota bacterium]
MAANEGHGPNLSKLRPVATFGRRSATWALLAGLVLGGCGTVPTRAVAVPALAAPATPAAQPPTLTVALASEPVDLQPDARINDPGYAIEQNIYNKLVTLDYGYDVIPDLASSWDVSPDGRQYTFHLAAGVTWSDGQPFTSADVVWTMDHILADHGVAASSLSAIDQVAAPDAGTVVMTLKHPDAAFLGFLAWYGTFILPQHVYQGTDWLTNPANTHPVGTGPFIFSDWQRGSRLTLVANPRYWKGAPAVSRVVFRFLADSAAAVQAVASGQADVDADTVPAAALGQLAKNPQVQVTRFLAPSRYYLAFNFRRRPGSLLAFRQAVAAAVDRQQVLTQALGGVGRVAQGMYTPVFAWAYDAEAQLPSYDPAAASRLLAGAGVAAGTPVDLLYFTGSPYGQIAANVRDQLDRVGLSVRLDQVDGPTYKARLAGSNPGFDLTLLDGFQGPDPAQLADRIGKGGAENMMGYDNPSIDALLAQASQLTGVAARGPLYQEVQALALPDLPILPLVEVETDLASATYVHGLPWTEAMGQVTFNDYSRVTVDPH